MPVSEQKIDVEEIMAEIRREIKEKGYQNEEVAFSDIPVHPYSNEISHSDALKENLETLRMHSNVAAYRPLVSNRLYGPLIVFVKKIIRKCMKFYVEPIVADQNVINKLMLSCIQDLHLDMEAMRLKIQSLESENAQLKEELDKL